jgi:cytoskeletal protein CcmA (bactofilin family)
MFKSKDKRDAGNLTIIAKGDCVEGTVRVAGRLHVDGEVDGSVIAEGPVSIGPDGSVKGEVRGTDVAIAGKIVGAVRARGSLHMLPTGIVEGDAYFDTLQVERGGVIYGHTGKAAEAAKEPAKDAVKDAPKLALANEAESETKLAGAR